MPNPHQNTTLAIKSELIPYSRGVSDSLSALGGSKFRRELLEREILGLLWRGKTAEAVWILRGLRSSARVPDRMDGLMGYLLRKRRMIVDYGERRAGHFWLSSTRVEKWNAQLFDRVRCLVIASTMGRVGRFKACSPSPSTPPKNTHEYVNPRKKFDTLHRLFLLTCLTGIVGSCKEHFCPACAFVI